MTQDQPVIRIGELLVQSGVITAYDLSEAEKLSSHMKVQFGRLLIMAGCLTEEALECALEAQGLIKQGMLTPQIACEALAFAVQENIPLRQSLEMLDCLPQFGTSTLRLAELIHDANIIDEERLHDAFDTSMETNKPLPEVLVEMDCISPGLLSIMLRMQEQIRNETLDREDSINELQGTFKIWKRADKAMANDPMSKSAIISAAPTEPIKTSRFTSSFDSVTRLPAMSPEILASLNKEAAPGVASGASLPKVPPPQSQSHQPVNASLPTHTSPAAAASPAPTGGAASVTPESRGKSADPTRGGKDDLNVDWILQDYANAPPGQPMPDGVILYSQGYFPPDPNSAANEEPFNEIFSDEDEQRINDLLDVFANDVSPGVSEGAHVGSASSDGYSQSGSNNSSYSSANTNFAQASYSASLAAAAADGWGVPDLAAAGANLSGAELFARAQAELASSGWAYSQSASHQPGQQSSSPNPRLAEANLPGSSGVGGNSPQAYTGPGSQPSVQPAAAPGPLGQPSFVTPAVAAPPKGLGHPDFYPGELARTSEPVRPAESGPVADLPRTVEPVRPVSPTSDKGDDSLFSPGLRDSIAGALDNNPFKIRKVVGESSNVSLSPLPDTLTKHAKNSETADENKSGNELEQVSGAESTQNEKAPDEHSSVEATISSKSEVEAPHVASNSGDSEGSAAVEQVDAKATNDDPGNDEPSHVSKIDAPEAVDSVSANSEDKAIPTLDETQPQTNVEPADSKAPPEAKILSESAVTEPRGKFGTKTGLAAKRKASETDDGVERNDVVFLLKSANFFSADELEEAVVACLRDATKAVEILGILGIIDKSNLDAAVRLQKLVKAGSVDLEKAVDSLKNLKSGKIRASELTEQLGIKKPKRRK